MASHEGRQRSALIKYRQQNLLVDRFSEFAGTLLGFDDYVSKF